MSDLSTKKSLRFLENGGEMGALILSKDWTGTALGNPDTWPASLRISLGIVLNSRSPMFLFWGPEHLCFYNDAFRPSLGNDGKHPSALGKRAVETWTEIWTEIKPLIDQVTLTGKASWSEDQLLPIYRNGALEDVYWTYSYSSIINDDGEVDGIFVAVSETTKKVESFKKVSESKTDLEFTITAAELGIFDLDPTTNKFTGNKRLKQWLGLTELSGPEIDLALAIEAIMPKDQVRVITEIERALQPSSGGNYNIDFTIIHPITRDERIVRARGKAFFNKNGEPYRFNGIVQDITRETLSRRMLAESEKTFRSMILQSPIAICILRGPIHLVEIANERMLELWGKTIADVVNKPLFRGLPEVKGQGVEDILYNVYTTGNAFTANEHPILLPRNGRLETTYINFIYEAIREGNGKISRVAVIATDVTEQVLNRKIAEENERQFRQIADSMPQMVWTAQPDGYLDYYNKQWYNYTGFKRSYGDQSWLPILHPDDADRCLKTWYNSVQTGKNYDIEYRFADRHNPGTYRWFLGRATPIKNDDGKIIKWFGTCTDINDQKLLQQQKDDFVSVASHELKTPLTSVKAGVQLIELLTKAETIDKAKLARIASNANTNLNKLNKLIEDLFNATRIEQGQLSMNKTDFNLYDAITESCEHIRLTGIHQISIKGDESLVISADKQKIEQVIVNLVNNAVKYGGESREISITFSDFPESVKVMVKDFGIGIAPAKVPYLFDRYYRVDTSGIQYAGLGLGLYISSEIIKKHNGTIGVDSTEGKGSCFWFTLPTEEKIK